MLEVRLQPKAIILNIWIYRGTIIAPIESCGLGDTAAIHLSNLIKDSTALKKIYLVDNDFNDSAGCLFVEATRQNQTIEHVDLAQNPLGYRYQEDVRKNLHRNLYYQHQNRVPDYTKQVDDLTQFESEKFIVVKKETELIDLQESMRREVKTLEHAKATLKTTELK